MNETLSSILTTVVPSIVTGVLTWFFTRRKNKAEVSASELENVEKALVIYRSIINDLNGKIKLLEAEIERLQAVVDTYKNNHNPNNP